MTDYQKEMINCKMLVQLYLKLKCNLSTLMLMRESLNLLHYRGAFLSWIPCLNYLLLINIQMIALKRWELLGEEFKLKRKLEGGILIRTSRRRDRVSKLLIEGASHSSHHSNSKWTSKIQHLVIDETTLGVCSKWQLWIWFPKGDKKRNGTKNTLITKLIE